MNILSLNCHVGKDCERKMRFWTQGLYQPDTMSMHEDWSDNFYCITFTEIWDRQEIESGLLVNTKILYNG